MAFHANTKQTLMSDPKIRWRELYRAALLEMDPAMLLPALEIVEQSIRARLRELENSTAPNHAHRTSEKQDIEDALRVLTLLRRESRKSEN